MSATRRPPIASAAPWLQEWPITYPKRRGHWTVTDKSKWGTLWPETGLVVPVNPLADKALPGLGPALAEGGQLVSYRHNRRAVVAKRGRFIKVLRASRVEAVAHRHQLAESLGIAAPKVLSVHRDGRIELSAIVGPSLNELLAGDTVTADQLRAVGRTLGKIHSHVPPPGLTPGDKGADQSWLDTTARADPEWAATLRRLLAELPQPNFRGRAVVHGDLHDKNLILSHDSVAVIDMDGLTTGAGEVDVGNLAAHLVLRKIQAGLAPKLAAGQVSAFLDGYREVRLIDLETVRTVQRHTWLRLAALYRFRDVGKQTSELLAAQAVCEALPDAQPLRHSPDRGEFAAPLR